jgi:hypothetical protein
MSVVLPFNRLWDGAAVGRGDRGVHAAALSREGYLAILVAAESRLSLASRLQARRHLRAPRRLDLAISAPPMTEAARVCARGH